MSLRDIIGHRRLTALISRAIERESLPPTLLFAGPSGVGKWRVAVAAAQALNCLEPIRTSRRSCRSMPAAAAARATASRAGCTST